MIAIMIVYDDGILKLCFFFSVIVVLLVNVVTEVIPYAIYIAISVPTLKNRIVIFNK